MDQQALLKCLSRMHGRALIYVWATQQDELSKRSIPVDTFGDEVQRDRPKDKGVDVFVPWVLSNPAQPVASKDKLKTKKRSKKKEGQEERTAQDGHPSCNVPSTSPQTASKGANDTILNEPDLHTGQTYNRYYHMFEEGELMELVCEAATDLGLLVGSAPVKGSGDGAGPQAVCGVEIVQDGWERSNYYVELRLWTGITA